MILRTLACAVLASAALLASATTAPAQVIIRDGGPGGMMVNPWGFGGGGFAFEQFMGTLTQLNMTTDFTLTVEAKGKLQAVREEWNKAQSDFRQEHRDELKELGQDVMEAYKAGDKEKIKDATKKQQEFMAKGPKAEDYIAKAKAVLTPEQLKLVEAKIAKDETEQKARMEQWQKMGGGERKPGAPAEPKKELP